jgi:flagellar protein FliJ
VKIFRFKLQSVLELRKRAENEAQQAHAEAGRKLEAALVAVAEAEGEAQAIIEDMAAMQNSAAAFKPIDREILWNGLRAKQQLAAKLKQVAELAAKEVEEKRAKLLHAQSEYQAMERLRDKAKQTYQHEMDLRESAAIDDIVNARYAAKGRLEVQSL